VLQEEDIENHHPMDDIIPELEEVDQAAREAEMQEALGAQGDEQVAEIRRTLLRKGPMNRGL